MSLSETNTKIRISYIINIKSSDHQTSENETYISHLNLWNIVSMQSETPTSPSICA